MIKESGKWSEYRLRKSAEKQIGCKGSAGICSTMPASEFLKELPKDADKILARKRKGLVKSWKQA